MRRFAYLTVILAILAVGVAVDPAAAVVAPLGFTTTTVATGFNYPTSVEFLPDGRMLVAEKAGVVWIVVNGVKQPTPVIDLSARVNDYGDRGLTGMAVDPNFASNGFIYLYYPMENSTPTASTKASRLSRFTMVGNTSDPATELILLGSANPTSCTTLAIGSDCIPADMYGHVGGALEFASDGTLFLGVGDSASWDVVDDNALRAQNLDSYAGKIIHITKLGKGISTNPFWTGNADDPRSKIWAYGFRNPFRLDLHPTTGIPYVSEVGWNDWEEIDKVPAGGNYGWPCYEGVGQQSGYAPKPVCQALYAQGTGAVVAPFLSQKHAEGHRSNTGALFLKGSAFPPLYQNAFMFGDYAADFIHYLEMTASGDLIGGEQGFATATDGPVDFTIGPDGAVYYVAILSGEVRRISYDSQGGGPIYVSDQPFVSATNGWGPYERDHSNAEQNAGDGKPITVAGVTYQKGIGVHATSSITLDLSGQSCSRFQSVIGIDDEVGNQGSVRFQITNGSTQLYQSAVLTGSSPTTNVDLNISGVNQLVLGVTDGGDGNSNDHADWADAKLTCGTDSTPPQVVSFSPAQGATGIGVTAAPVVRFNEPLDPATVTNSTVTLATQPAGTAVAGSLIYDATARSVTFTPTSPLTQSTSYKFQVLGGSSGVTDLGGNHLAATASATFTTGSGGVVSYVSDATWGSVTNGWGQPERDRSNGEQGSADGGPIRVAGTTYAKGVGSHANSTIPLDLTGQACTRFQSVVGIDDEVGNQGSVRFQLWNGTGTMITQSAVLTGASAAATIDIDISNVTNLRLVVTDNGDGNSFDHADWADAKLTCGTASSLPPTVFIDTPVAGQTFAVNDTVSFTGHAKASDGSDIAPAQLQWDVQLRHCPLGTCHLHPLTQTTGVGGSVVFPDHGDDSHIDIKLTATDGAGRSASVTFTAEPKLVNLILASTPTGRPLQYNGETVTAPATRAVVVGGTRTITAADGGGYVFQSWSDGGAAQHNVTLGTTNMTVTAAFTGGGSGQTAYVSDLTWGTATNGWGPPERDHSNNQQGANDGGPIVVAGTTYAKGVGAHANSTIPLDLTGMSCTRFQSVVGIDDEVGNQGSVRFQVWNGTTTMLTQSAALTGASAAATIDIDITSVTNLQLVITDNGDGNSYDHADWADAKVTCGSTVDSSPPTVSSTSPADGAAGVVVTVKPAAFVSEPLNPSTVNTTTVKLTTQPGGANVAGTVTYDDTARSITFSPSSSLAANTQYRLQILGGASGIADVAGNRLMTTANANFTTASASAQIHYVSDMTWGTATNGWGPPERDHSNNQQGANDGGPIVVAGTTYPKGVGAHAVSAIPISLSGLGCTRFQAVVGLDDEVGNLGSVVFQVWNGTTTMLTQSATLTGSSPAAVIDVDITSVTNLRLVITDAGDGNSYDHSDWADAKVTCTS